MMTGSFFSVEVKSYKIKCKRKRMKNAKGKNGLTTSYVSKDISRLWIGIVFSHFFNAQFYIILSRFSNISSNTEWDGVVSLFPPLIYIRNVSFTQNCFPSFLLTTTDVRIHKENYDVKHVMKSSEETKKKKNMEKIGRKNWFYVFTTLTEVRGTEEYWREKFEINFRTSAWMISAKLNFLSVFIFLQ